jgi:hypothetical protein
MNDIMHKIKEHTMLFQKLPTESIWLLEIVHISQ